MQSQLESKSAYSQRLALARSVKARSVKGSVKGEVKHSVKPEIPMRVLSGTSRAVRWSMDQPVALDPPKVQA